MQVEVVVLSGNNQTCDLTDYNGTDMLAAVAVQLVYQRNSKM